MENNLIVYKNDMNTVPLRNFTPIELDLFFTIIGQMRDKGLNEINFSFEDLKNLSDYDFTKGLDRFVDDLERTYDKLIRLNVKIGTSRKWTKFVFFTKYSVDKDTETIGIATNPEFAHLINEVTGNFTKMELQEFVSLSSSYSKTAYRLLKQYRKTGYAIFKLDKFKELFSVPKSYRMSDIDKRILNPIKEELTEHFENLEITKVAKGRGRKITHIHFTFNAETDVREGGSKTFRTDEKGYYNKHILDFDEREVQVEFPHTPEPLNERTDKNIIQQKIDYLENLALSDDIDFEEFKKLKEQIKFLKKKLK